MGTLWVSMWGPIFWESTTKSRVKHKRNAKDPAFWLPQTTSSGANHVAQGLLEPNYPPPPLNWSHLGGLERWPFGDYSVQENRTKHFFIWEYPSGVEWRESLSFMSRKRGVKRITHTIRGCQLGGKTIPWLSYLLHHWFRFTSPILCYQTKEIRLRAEPARDGTRVGSY